MLAGNRGGRQRRHNPPRVFIAAAVASILDDVFHRQIPEGGGVALGDQQRNPLPLFAPRSRFLGSARSISRLNGRAARGPARHHVRHEPPDVGYFRFQSGKQTRLASLEEQRSGPLPSCFLASA